MGWWEDLGEVIPLVGRKGHLERRLAGSSDPHERSMLMKQIAIIVAAIAAGMAAMTVAGNAWDGN